MKFPCLVIPALLIVLLTACKQSEGPLDQDACSILKMQERIIDGTPCDIESSPVVEITLLFESGQIGLCSGTLITSRHVLSAAHCFLPTQDDDVLRDFSVTVQGYDTQALQVTTHPDANPPQNDVAVITLARAAAVRPLPLLLSHPIVPGDVIAIFGYGFDEENEFAALKSGEMEVTGVTAQDIYARFEGGEGSSICLGDSGGPAVYSLDDRPAVVGVTSYATSERCVATGFAAFANVQGRSIIDFIIAQAPDVEIL